MLCAVVVVVVKWSACLPSTLKIRVRIPLTSTVFSEKICVGKNENKQKRGQGWPILKQTFLLCFGGCHHSLDLAVPTILRPRGSNPKHNIYAFAICNWIVRWKGRKFKKEAGIWAYLKNFTFLQCGSDNFANYFCPQKASFKFHLLSVFCRHPTTNHLKASSW